MASHKYKQFLSTILQALDPASSSSYGQSIKLPIRLIHNAFQKINSIAPRLQEHSEALQAKEIESLIKNCRIPKEQRSQVHQQIQTILNDADENPAQPRYTLGD